MRWLIDPASTQGATMRGDWYVFIVAGLCVGAFVYACIFWCIIAYRRRDGRDPARFTRNTPLEITYVVIPLLIVIGLFGVTLRDEISVDAVSPNPGNHVGVTAFRWSWRFAYPGGFSTSGTPADPPTLYLPLGRPTQIELTSIDVTHSFWIPAFLFKRDAIPGVRNDFDVTPARIGMFLGRCAQFCGIDHALMTFEVKVVPEAAYDRYLASRGRDIP